MKLKYCFLLTFFAVNSYSQIKSAKINNSQKEVAAKLMLKNLEQIAEVDERYQSFNVEMCEVIGGNFWVPYGIMDSVRKTSKKKGFEALKWQINPINLYEKKIRMLAKAFGPSYVRVSGTWANTIYFQDNDQPIMAQAPEGFNNVLTRAQWKGVLDFCKAVDGKLVTSFAICPGIHDKDGNWNSAQLESLLNYTKSVGGQIAAVSMYNEPSHSGHGGAPAGYDAASYVKDYTFFKNFIRNKAPEIKIMGLGSTGEGGIIPSIQIASEDILSTEPKPQFDIFDYHYYGTISKRCFGTQTPEKALSQEWLSRTELGFEYYEKLRDKYNLGAPIWLSETGETACGGNPWAATFLDTFRYLEQLGRLAKKGVKVVMHNTLARSEYALLDHDTHNPRPSYWAGLLWNRLMGTKVYDAGTLSEGVDIYAHNLKNSEKGIAVMIVNTTASESAVAIPSSAQQYLLTAKTKELQTKNILLNGKDLKLTVEDKMPEIKGRNLQAGRINVPPHSIMFLSFDRI